MKLYFVRTNASDMLIADHGDHCHFVTEGLGVNPNDEHEASDYLTDNIEALVCKSREWEETEETVEELTNGAVILAEIEESEDRVTIESVKKVSEIQKVYLSEGICILVVPSDDKEGWYDLILRIQTKVPTTIRTTDETMTVMLDHDDVSFMFSCEADDPLDVLEIIETEAKGFVDSQLRKIQEEINRVNKTN